MVDPNMKSALIVGAGPGISAALARRLTGAGVRTVLVARDVAKLQRLADETGSTTFAADVTSPQEVKRLFAEVDGVLGVPDAVIYNAANRQRGNLTELDPEEVQRSLAVLAFGGFLVAQEAAKRMIPVRRGAILFTGATASVKGFPRSTPFAMGKFALRGLAQCAARELGPMGIHVAHVIVDGAVRSATRPDGPNGANDTLDPDAIAKAYHDILLQPRSAWSFEMDLRPWSETF